MAEIGGREARKAEELTGLRWGESFLDLSDLGGMDRLLCVEGRTKSYFVRVICSSIDINERVDTLPSKPSRL